MNLKMNSNPACQGCLFDAGNMCTSKTKKKDLKYQKKYEGNSVFFSLVYCGERKVSQTVSG